MSLAYSWLTKAISPISQAEHPGKTEERQMEALQPSEPNDSQAGFVNKVLLEDSHLNLFAYRLWLLSYSPSKLSSCYKDLVAPRAKTFTSSLL